ncbi:MAG: hypothetical protein Q7J57_14035 [Gemmobacter sp.]|nr:hypothetical protein [Gemmobacter sp.]
MHRKHKVLMIGGMVAIAATAGHLMQNGGVSGPKPESSMASMSPTPGSIVPLAATASEATNNLVSTTQQPAMREAAAPSPVADQADVAREPALVQAVDPAKTTGQDLAATVVAPVCPIDMALIPQPGAMVDMGLLAPCHANERVVIRHGGLAITGKISAAGSLIASLPAFATPATVSVLFADGTTADGTTDVTDLSNYDRFAVQWMDQDAFQLHAYEGDASFGQPGHVSAAAPRKIAAAGSFLNIVGDAATDRPLLAEIYTYPAGVSALARSVRLNIEAAVTEQTCGREILGETIQMTGGKSVVRDLTVSMSGCDTVGEFLLLSDPVLDDKLASN